MLTKLEELDISKIKNAGAAVQQFAALTKLSKLMMADAGLLSTSSLARLTTLTALDIRSVVDWVRPATPCIIIIISSVSGGSVCC